MQRSRRSPASRRLCQGIWVRAAAQVPLDSERSSILRFHGAIAAGGTHQELARRADISLRDRTRKYCRSEVYYCVFLPDSIFKTDDANKRESQANRRIRKAPPKRANFPPLYLRARTRNRKPVIQCFICLGNPKRLRAFKLTSKTSIFD